ncbi:MULTISPECIES: fatty acid desaturase family protein [Isoptericola]|uniref:fatty acid desaturase family protein n=1 Tax=Isoptericola TaxID=254250 RepID=UPI00383A2443
MTTTPLPPQARHQVSTYTDLARRIKDEGLLERSGRRYLVRALVLAGAFGVALTALLTLGNSWWQLLVAAGSGVLFTQVAFVGHDAAHRQIFASGRKNEWTSRVVANLVVGLSHGWWVRKHTRHHANPNKVGADEDIRPGVILFTTEDVPRRTGIAGWFTRHQGWLFFPLLTLEGLALHVGAVRTVVTDRALKHRGTEAALLAVRLIGWPLLLVAALGPALGAAFLAVQLMVFGVYMGASFAPNHKGMPLVPRDTRIDFLSRQVLTSRNIRGGRWVDHLMGGLNLQIEHHLFPSMPSGNLHRARPMVRAYCAEHDVPYTEAGLLESYGIVVRHLNRVGLSDRDPFTCPFVTAHRTG